MNVRRTNWATQLDDALRDYRTVFKTLTGMSPYELLFEKYCHLSIELAHKILWTLLKLNIN